MRPTLTALIAAALWATMNAAGLLEPIERLTMAARFVLRPPPGFAAPITLIAIDERSLSRLGQMPWDRRVIAKLLDRLADADARTVGLDLAFTEPARTLAEDAALAKALGRIPTVLPTFLAYADAGRMNLKAVDPLSAFRDAAAGLGSVQLSSKPQAEVWEVEPLQFAMGRGVPAFPMAIARAYAGSAWSVPTLGLPWRADPFYIDFRGPANTAPQVSALDMLDGKVPRSALTGRIALIGAVAPGLPDTNFRVPDFRGGPMSGVEIFANVIDNALGTGGLRRLHEGSLAGLLLVLALLLGPLLTTGSRGAAKRGLTVGVAVVAWLTLAVMAVGSGIWLDVVPVVGWLSTAYVVGILAERTYLLQSRNLLLARYASDLGAEARRQRTRIEGELHDGIQQILIVIRREIRQVQRNPAAPEASARVDLVGQLTESAEAEIKRLRADLLPPALRDGGLLEALPSLAKEASARGELDVQVEVADWRSLSREREIELYWLVKEALNNVEKHASAKHVQIRLFSTRTEARIEVVDDGRGFELPDLSLPPIGVDHSGLHRMWLRMRGNDGELKIESTPGAGTCVQLSLSIDARRTVT